MKHLIIAAFIAVNLISTASAQSPKPMSIEQLAAYDKPDREKILYAGAKGEGKITWYTSLAGTPASRAARTQSSNSGATVTGRPSR